MDIRRVLRFIICLAIFPAAIPFACISVFVGYALWFVDWVFQRKYDEASKQYYKDGILNSIWWPWKYIVTLGK